MIVAKDIFIVVERWYMNISANSNGLISEITLAMALFENGKYCIQTSMRIERKNMELITKEVVRYFTNAFVLK